MLSLSIRDGRNVMSALCRRIVGAVARRCEGVCPDEAGRSNRLDGLANNCSLSTDVAGLACASLDVRYLCVRRVDRIRQQGVEFSLQIETGRRTPDRRNQ